MRKLLVLMAIFVLSLAAMPASAQEDNNAYVRFVHAANNAGAVDVYINGQARSFTSEKEFGWISGWLIFPLGDLEVAVTPAGRSLSTAIVEPTTLSLESGQRITIAVVGDAQAADGNVFATIFEEDAYGDLSEFSARVTVLHAIADAPAVDVVDEEGNIVLGRLGFPGSITLLDGGTNDGAVTITPDLVEGTYDLFVVPNGQSGPTVLDLSGTELEGGNHYLVIAAGTLEEPQVLLSVEADS